MASDSLSRGSAEGTGIGLLVVNLRHTAKRRSRTEKRRRATGTLVKEDLGTFAGASQEARRSWWATWLRAIAGRKAGRRRAGLGTSCASVAVAHC
jgi:hypothetical protein